MPFTIGLPSYPLLKRFGTIQLSQVFNTEEYFSHYTKDSKIQCMYTDTEHSI